MKVSAYCRVSTDKDDQINSFENQKRYFEQFIGSRPEWQLAEIYADEGISGTTTKKRAAFQTMIADAKAGKFNLILTKEVSRFARNTIDTLQYTRRLKKWGVGVYFMNDNINTLDPDAELRLTIMSSIAQEESRKTSERVKWGQKRQMERGIVFGRDMLGYDVYNGKLFINETGAEIVRTIFRKFVQECKSTYKIAQELQEAGYKTMTGNCVWSNTVVLKVIRNEKYCGDLIQKKTYTPDYLSHEKKYNHGEEEFVILKNHHEPIISRDLWNQAQAELGRRSHLTEQKKKYSSRYPLSGKIICGRCGARFVSRVKIRKDKSRYQAWRCYEAVRYGTPNPNAAGNMRGCTGTPQISNDDFMRMIAQVIRDLPIERENLFYELMQAIKTVIEKKERNGYTKREAQQKLSVLLNKKEKLLDLYLSGDLSRADYRLKKDSYEQEIIKLQEISYYQPAVQDDEENFDAAVCRIAGKIRSLMMGRDMDDSFVRSMVYKIMVYDATNIKIYLNTASQKES